ncbi:hypothetical protein TNCV_1391441 [Trichonephila clavipes]|nr:hypothetical protein TNCV_1391441 [Trichonephila clavipes]
MSKLKCTPFGMVWKLGEGYLDGLLINVALWGNARDIDDIPRNQGCLWPWAKRLGSRSTIGFGLLQGEWTHGPDLALLISGMRNNNTVGWTDDRLPTDGSPCLSIGCLGRAPRSRRLERDCKGPNKLDVIRFPGNKFRSASAKGTCRSFALKARN